MFAQQVPVTGLKTPFRDGTLRHVAEQVLKLAKVNYFTTNCIKCLEMHIILEYKTQ